MASTMMMMEDMEQGAEERGSAGMARKPKNKASAKTAFDMGKSARRIRLKELQPRASTPPPVTPPSPAQQINAKHDKTFTSPGNSQRHDWQPPRSATRATTLKELAQWLDMSDAEAVRAAADEGTIRLRRVSPRRFEGCMMDVARLNPMMLDDAARE